MSFWDYISCQFRNPLLLPAAILVIVAGTMLVPLLGKTLYAVIFGAV